MRLRRVLPVLLAALGALAGPVARADTTCSFAGPTPGFRAVKVDLPDGAPFATIQLSTASPTANPAGGRASWHFVEGFAIVNAATRELASSRIVSLGSSTRTVVVEADGTDGVRQEIVAPDAPFRHEPPTTVVRLDPGSYYLIGFGSDGDRRTPNPIWGAEFHLGADVPCTPTGDGDLFDLDQTQFHGGTQASASVAGFGESERARFTTARSLVFGLMDAHTQFAGDATLRYTLGDGSTGTVSNQIVPFVGGPGAYSFVSDFSGAFPVTLVAGVALGL